MTTAAIFGRVWSEKVGMMMSNIFCGEILPRYGITTRSFNVINEIWAALLISRISDCRSLVFGVER